MTLARIPYGAFRIASWCVYAIIAAGDADAYAVVQDIEPAPAHNAIRDALLELIFARDVRLERVSRAAIVDPRWFNHGRHFRAIRFAFQAGWRTLPGPS